MSKLLRKLCTNSVSPCLYRSFSVSAVNNKTYSCKVLVVGGGTGGCTMAAKFSRRLGKDAVIVLEPSNEHYYQPLWTLVGAGAKKLSDTRRTQHSVMPKNAIWVQDCACGIDPEKMFVSTRGGDIINYEYLIIAVGLNNDFKQIPGLEESLANKHSGVSTIYSPDYCEKTWHDMKNFKGGNAIFTYPNSLIKCPGAPQKIAYLADSCWTKTKVRSKVNITYNTCLPVIFGVKKYADVLLKVVERKKINVNYRTVLKAINPEKREATFYNACDPSKETTMPYDFLHVTPPMVTSSFLRDTTLVDKAGFLDVNKFTLQHTNYKNIYGIGDCTNTPNSKTAAAIAPQCYVVEKNLLATMACNEPKMKYNGYGACPLVTSYSTCVLAEFLYDGIVHETFPFNQVTAYESRWAYYMKKDLFPLIYWSFMLKGYYHGPETMRKVMKKLAMK